MERTLLFDLDNSVQPLLFRILCSYLDQGIALWHFPFEDQGLRKAIAILEENSFTSFSKPRERASYFWMKKTALKKCWKCLLVIAVIMSNISGISKMHTGLVGHGEHH